MNSRKRIENMCPIGFAPLVPILMGRSVAGCALGGACTYFLQEVGLNMGDAFAQSGLMLNDVARARLSVDGFVRGVIPGLTASVLGTLVAGLAIFKRSEANLFRELEAG